MEQGEGEGLIFRRMKTQVGKALFLSSSLSTFPRSSFTGRLRGGPHGVNHPCQAVDLVEHLPERHPERAALLPLLSPGSLSLYPASLFICLSIPWSLGSRIISPSLSLSHSAHRQGITTERIPQDREQRRSLDINEKVSLAVAEGESGIIDMPTNVPPDDLAICLDRRYILYQYKRVSKEIEKERQHSG